MSHQIKIETRTDHILVTCTCGWSSKWKTADGSAQQAAAEHRRNNHVDPCVQILIDKISAPPLTGEDINKLGMTQ